jgi:FixJ family two-component response regulator
MFTQHRKPLSKKRLLLYHEQFGIPNMQLDEVAADGNSSEPRLLLLTDDPQVQGEVTDALAHSACRLQVLAHPDEIRVMGFPPSPTCMLCSHPMRNGVTGFDALEAIHERGFLIPTLFITADWNLNLVVRAMRAGADDFLTLPLTPDRLRDAVEQALQEARQRWDLSRAIAVAKARVASLDKREREVVRLVLNGLLNKEIADHLELALVTVKVYRARAMKKLGAGNAHEMVRVVGLAGMCNEPPIPRPG